MICVEPTPTHMSKQRQLLTGLPVTHEEAALSNTTAKATFYWCGVNTTMNSLQDRGDRQFEVNTITLKDLCDKHQLKSVDFCKIDIEGSETIAITEETLRPIFPVIKKIFIELHPPNKESQERFTKIFDAVGYKVKPFIHDSLFCYK